LRERVEDENHKEGWKRIGNGRRDKLYLDSLARGYTESVP
jgi:hypothetical protein